MTSFNDITFPEGAWLEFTDEVWTPERTDAWQQENRALRRARGEGDFEDDPMPTIPFVLKE